jgi:hypothetical protein
MSDFADQVIGLVRDQLRRHPAFVGVTRDEFDNAVLADLECDIRRGFEEWTDEVVREAMLEEMKAEKKKKRNTKRRAAA